MISLFLFTFFSSNAYSFSKSPSFDGEVEVKIINNTPCLYINKTQLNGEYILMVSKNDKESNTTSWFYRNSFQKHYPLENQCILLNSSNFQNLKLLENEAYYINLLPGENGGDQFASPSFDGFASQICLKRNNKKQLQIQDYIYGQCMDKEPKTPKVKAATDTDSKSWFERLLGWFKSL